MIEAESYVSKGARISSCGNYRYRLWREWRGTHDPNHWRWFGCYDGAGHLMGEPLSVLFIMLNPSTADGSKDDPTIRRCVGFAQRWKYERLEVVNLFAFRATKPTHLMNFAKQGGDPVGWENSEAVEKAARRAGLVVCAWGAHNVGEQGDIMRGWLHDKQHYALGFTRDGSPRHPLYARADSKLILMPP